MTEEQIAELEAALVADGYNPDTAEALANREVSPAEARSLSKRELLDHYLCWNGMVGWTGQILAVLEDAERNCNL